MTKNQGAPIPAPSRPASARWLAPVLLLGLVPGLSGCAAPRGGLVIENKTLVLVIPPGSREVEMYYVFEGLSVSGDGEPGRAERQLAGLKEPGFSFFLPAEQPSNSPLLKHFRSPHHQVIRECVLETFDSTDCVLIDVCRGEYVIRSQGLFAPGTDFRDFGVGKEVKS